MPRWAGSGEARRSGRGSCGSSPTRPGTGAAPPDGGRPSSSGLAEDRRPGDAAPSPESAVLDREEQAWLLGAINGLGDDDRDVITARYFLDLSEAETAELLGIPRGTVKSRLSRALGRLRTSIGDDAEARDG